MNHDEAPRRSRALRVNSTEAERILWATLRNRGQEGHKFRRQVTIGPYIVDFVCCERRLVVELDGSQHAGQRKYDEERTQFLNDEGYRVLRFANEELLADPAAVEERIRRALRESPLKKLK